MTSFMDNFKHLRCKAHPEYSCSFVCFEDDCPERGLVCVECIADEHKEHGYESLPLKLNVIREDLTNLNDVSIKMAQIDEQHIRTVRFCNQLPAKEKSLLSYYISLFYEDVSQKIINYMQSGRVLLEEKAESIHQANKLILLYRKVDRKEGDDNLTEFQCYLRDILSALKDRADQLQQGIKAKEEATVLVGLFSLLSTERKANYLFSETMKHSSIQVIDQRTAVQKNNYSTNFILIEPCIEKPKKSLRSKKSISFRIDKLMSWMSIGVVYGRLAEKANYYFNTGQVGHGGYLISNNGYSWHSVDTNLNSFYEQWNYVQGDILTVTVDPKSKKIIFSKQDNLIPYELPYESIPDDELYFCVSLSCHEETISIVEE